MSKQKMRLNLGTLGDLRGGAVGKIFDQKLSGVIADCNDRPGNKTARKVIIEVAVTPVDDDLEGEKVDIECSVHSKVPVMAIKAHQARVSKTRDKATGRDVYHADFGGDPEDADQLTLGNGGGD